MWGLGVGGWFLSVRTTLDTDDDMHAAARELARRQGTSAGHVVSRLSEGDRWGRCGTGRPDHHLQPGPGRAADQRLLKRTVARGEKGVWRRAQASMDATRAVTSRMKDCSWAVSPDWLCSSGAKAIHSGDGSASG